MLEIRYNQWTAWLQTGVGIGVAGLGAYVAYQYTEQVKLEYGLGNLGVVVLGLLIAHMARLRLQERGVMVRFTEQEVWTKELGWQPWNKLRVVLDVGRNEQGMLKIHRPPDAARRFFAYTGVLDASTTEMKSWIQRYGAAPESGLFG